MTTSELRDLALSVDRDKRAFERMSRAVAKDRDVIEVEPDHPGLNGALWNLVQDSVLRDRIDAMRDDRTKFRQLVEGWPEDAPRPVEDVVWNARQRTAIRTLVDLVESGLRLR